MSRPDDRTAPGPMGDLSALQKVLIRVFLDSGAAGGFVLVGGGALIAHGLVPRQTRDLDFFNVGGLAAVDIRETANIFEAQCRDRQLSTARLMDTPTFAQVQVSSADDTVVVDFAIDAPLVDEPIASIHGPTPSVLDLAAMKLLALFSRAAPRDFVDVKYLAHLVGKPPMQARAAALDLGFNLPALADALRAHRRIPDDRFPVPADQVSELREFAEQWLAEIESAGH